MRLSPNFTLAQLTRSDTAARLCIDNRPDAQQIANLARLADCLEQVQSLLGHPLVINSAFRAPALNAAVGGAPLSRHAVGLAVDFTCAEFGSPLEVARAIAQSPLKFDQLIHEYGRWVHLGLAPEAYPLRRELMTICGSQSGYTDGLSPCG